MQKELMVFTIRLSREKNITFFEFQIFESGELLMGIQTDDALEAGEKKASILKKHRSKKPVFILLAILGIAAVFAIGWFGSEHFSTSGRTTKLGFEDIGELATQSVVCTCVRNEQEDRNILGISIPFTESVKIYSYDTVIKAGINFSDVKVVRNDVEKKIYVEIPEVTILSTELKLDSFQKYYEKDNIFTPISMDEHNDALKELEESATNTAIENGLMDKALENAKLLLKSFIGQVYDLTEYSIVFAE